MILCERCKLSKPRCDFHKSSKRPSGCQAWCKPCEREYRMENAERRRAQQASWVARNAEQHQENQRRWREANGERVRATEQAWRDANRSHVAAVGQAYRDSHRDERAAAARQHYAAKKDEYVQRARERSVLIDRATPAWADRAEMAMWANVAEVLSHGGVRFEVDHVVPLRSDRVCGLHTHDNMQILTRRANRAKGNRIWPDMPEPQLVGHQ